MAAPTPDFRQVAQDLAPLLEQESNASDQALTLTKPLVEAFTKQGLFHLMVPTEYGGYDADAGTCLDVFEELAYSEGSIGWTLMANAAATAYVAYLDPDAARTMVEGRPDSVFAGQFAPRGHITRAEDGFNVTGNYSFGSGSGHATYLGGGGFVLGDDGQPEPGDNGMPYYLCYFVPKEECEMQGGWDVMGLKGTGSFDYEVKPQVVQSGSSFPLFSAEVKNGGPVHGLGPTAIAGIGHAGWGLGVARRALDEIKQITSAGRTRLGSVAVKDQQVFQRDLGRNELALQSVRLLVHEVFGRQCEGVAKGIPRSPADTTEMMAATAYMTEVCEDATLFAYRWAGSQGLRNPSFVQQCFRDMFTGGRHMYVDQKSYEAFVQPMLNLS